MHITTGRLAGVEAFVRWPHAVHGMIGPSDIIPFVDEAGLHVEFDRLVSLQALGVRLATEEYATGSRPRGKVTFDTLKIPYPISREHHVNAETIVAVVAEAKKIGARVVADSVESVEQEEALRSLGVGIVQGYLYGPEVTASELRTLITRPVGSLP